MLNFQALPRRCIIRKSEPHGTLCLSLQCGCLSSLGCGLSQEVEGLQLMGQQEQNLPATAHGAVALVRLHPGALPRQPVAGFCHFLWGSYKLLSSREGQKALLFYVWPFWTFFLQPYPPASFNHLLLYQKSGDTVKEGELFFLAQIGDYSSRTVLWISIKHLPTPAL